MGLKVTYGGMEAHVPEIIAAEDLYLDADSTKAVTEGGRFLLARKGQPVPRAYTGLVTDTGKPKGKTKPKGRAKAANTKELKPGSDK